MFALLHHLCCRVLRGTYRFVCVYRMRFLPSFITLRCRCRYVLFDVSLDFLVISVSLSNQLLLLRPLHNSHGCVQLCFVTCSMSVRFTLSTRSHIACCYHCYPDNYCQHIMYVFVRKQVVFSTCGGRSPSSPNAGLTNRCYSQAVAWCFLEECLGKARTWPCKLGIVERWNKCVAGMLTTRISHIGSVPVQNRNIAVL